MKIQVGELLLSVDFCVPPFGGTVHRDQPVRLRIRKRLEQHAADQAKHQGGCSRAKRQRQERDRNKPGVLPKTANRVTEVLKEVRSPAPSPHVARDFLGDGHVPEFTASGMSSFFFRRSRSEEHTSELQSHHDLVCRLLLEKKKKKRK